MARPSKYKPETVDKICDLLKVGNTRKTAYTCAGINDNTFARWLARYGDFAERVSRAEKEAESRHVAIIARAAAGQDTRQVTRTTKTVFKKRITKFPDGKVVDEFVPHEEVTMQVIEGRENDWRAALELTKRRNKEEWGDYQQHAVDREIMEFIALLSGGAGEGSDPPISVPSLP